MADRDKPEDKSEGREITAGLEFLSAQIRQEFDIAITTAKAYPRDVAKSIDQAMAIVKRNGVAKPCVYTLKKGGENIVGPSVRLAEIWFGVWPNLHSAVRVPIIDANFVHAQALIIDLEQNRQVGWEIVRSIQGKHGRYSNDMIQITTQAATAIAWRDAIFKAIPRPIWYPSYELCLEIIVGPPGELAERREAAFAYFEKIGISRERVLWRLKKENIAVVDGDDLVVLRGILNAIQDKEVELEAAFPFPGVKETRALDLGAALERNKPSAKASSSVEGGSVTTAMAIEAGMLPGIPLGPNEAPKTPRADMRGMVIGEIMKAVHELQGRGADLKTIPEDLIPLGVGDLRKTLKDLQGQLAITPIRHSTMVDE